jgi:hypothetical protein
MFRAIVFVALCAGFPPGLLAGERETYIGFTFGKNYAVTISEQDFQNSPAWDPHAENPPLAAQRALKLATAAKDTLVHDSKTWKWRAAELTLTNFGSRDDPRKWYWAVRYQADHAPEPALAASAGVAPELTVIVRMDGTVLPPAGDGPQERPSSTRTPPPMPKPLSLSETRFVERGLLLHITDAFGITKDVRRPLHSNTLFSHAIGNNRYQIYLRDEDLLKGPEWKTDAANPPVSARKAIQLASQAKETLVKDTPVYNWKFAEAALRFEPIDQRWYWLILLERRPRTGNVEEDARTRLFGVLMDGTALKPTLYEPR